MPALLIWWWGDVAQVFEFPLAVMWPASSTMVSSIIGAQRKLHDGRIEANYESHAELGQHVRRMLELERAVTEERLEKGMIMLDAAGGDEKRQTLLMIRWKQLINWLEQINICLEQLCQA